MLLPIRCICTTPHRQVAWRAEKAEGSSGQQTAKRILNLKSRPVLMSNCSRKWSQADYRLQAVRKQLLALYQSHSALPVAYSLRLQRQGCK
jgi:hypothetical protein